MIRSLLDLRKMPIATACGLLVAASSPAMAQLGQSKWQMPAHSSGQVQRPQHQASMSGDGFESESNNSQLGQSQWIQPESSSSGLGKSEWINPGGGGGQASGQSQWMQSDNANTGLGKSQWINPNSNAAANSDMGQSQWQQPETGAGSSSSPKLIGAVLQEEQKINEPGMGLAPGFTCTPQNMAAPAGNALNEPAETATVQSQPSAPQANAVGAGAALGTLLGSNGNQAASMLQMAQTVPLAMQMLMNAMPHGPGGGGFGAPGMGMAPGIGGGYGGGYGTGSNIANRVVRRTTNQAANRLEQGFSQMINQIGRR
jgi:hypothetical protein